MMRHKFDDMANCDFCGEDYPGKTQFCRPRGVPDVRWWRNQDDFDSEVKKQLDSGLRRMMTALRQRDDLAEAAQMALDWWNLDTQPFVKKYGHGVTTKDVGDRIREALAYQQHETEIAP